MYVSLVLDASTCGLRRCHIQRIEHARTGMLAGEKLAPEPLALSYPGLLVIALLCDESGHCAEIEFV